MIFLLRFSVKTRYFFICKFVLYLAKILTFMKKVLFIFAVLVSSFVFCQDRDYNHILSIIKTELNARENIFQMVHRHHHRSVHNLAQPFNFFYSKKA